MYIVQKDMRDLKEKASVERIKAKQEARLVNMEKERDWFRHEALQLDKMNKDHKRLVIELRQRLEAVSEDKEFLQTQLVQAKSLNRNAMFELDQYKQKHGDMDVLDQPAWKGITAELGMNSSGVGAGTGMSKGTNIFEPTALPEQHVGERRN